MITYAANACRTATDSNCSAARLENLMKPSRVKVKRATGSQNSEEHPIRIMAHVEGSATTRIINRF